MTTRPDPEPTSWGTRRRLQALASRGWSPRAIQAATGIPARRITSAIAGQRVTSQDLNLRVAAAYDQLWDKQPPRTTRREQALADNTRANAERNDWAPPMAWDDDIIDLPGGRPAPGWKPPAYPKRRSAHLVEDADWVRAHGGYRLAPMSEVAARLGVSQVALAKAHERAADREAEAG
jgi:hypothetical protein